MAVSDSRQDIQERMAALLGLPESELDYLQQLGEGVGNDLIARVEAAIEERRHVILQALDDAGRHLPGPLRRKLSQRIQGD